jgi:hypothetical protein
MKYLFLISLWGLSAFAYQPKLAKEFHERQMKLMEKREKEQRQIASERKDATQEQFYEEKNEDSEIGPEDE